MSNLGFLDDFLNQMRRNEVNTLAVAKYDVSRHHGGLADTNGNVDACEHHIADGRRMNSAKVRRHIKRIDSFQVANGTVDDKAGLGSRVNRRGQIVANKGATLDLPEEIDDDDIARLQEVYDALVIASRHPFSLGVGVRNVGNVRAKRHELCRDGAANQFLAGVQQAEPACKLVLILRG